MRIKRVKRLKLDEPVAVFDLTVPSTSNFTLAAGPVVHNSKDVADALTATVYHLSQTSTGHRVYIPTKGVSETDKPKGGWSKGDYRWGDEEPPPDDDGDLPRYIVI